MTPFHSTREQHHDRRENDSRPPVIELLQIPLPAEYQALLEESGARCAGRLILPADGDLGPLGVAGEPGLPAQWLGLREGAEVRALALLRGRGEVADLVMARDADATRTLPPLLAALERLARERGAAEIEVFLPDPGEGPYEPLLERAGYRAVDMPATTLQVIDWPAFLEALDPKDREPAHEIPGESPCLDIRSGGFGPPPGLLLQLTPTPFGVRPTEAGEAPAGGALRLNASDLTSWLLGGLGDDALLGRVSGQGDTGRYLSILKPLRLDGRWSTPLGHRR